MSTVRNSLRVLTGVVVAMGAILIFSGCGKPTPPPAQLDVSILNVSHEINGDTFANAFQKYDEKVADVIVSCTPESFESDSQVDALMAVVSRSDIVIFSSLWNTVFRGQSDLFHPILSPALAVAPVLKEAYAGAEANTYWAVPLLMDPLVMVVKKANLNDTNVPRDWISITSMIKLQSRTAPHFVLLNNSPLSLADFVAANQLAFGYQIKHILHRDPEAGIQEKEIYARLARSLMNMKAYMMEPSEKRLDHIPQVKSIQDFLDSNAYFTFIRYSDYLSLSEPMQKRLFVCPIPKGMAPVYPCYVVAAAIPIQSDHPYESELLIHYLTELLEPLSKEHRFLPVSNPDKNLEKSPLFSKKAVFVPRENHTALGEKIVIDGLNGDLSIQELNALWESGFFIPKRNI